MSETPHTRVFIVRHCQSKANVERRYNCTLEQDHGLSEPGLIQAEKLSEFFDKIKLSKIYASPFPRAKQTAQAIAKKMNTKIEVVERFREHKCGAWNGKTEMEIMEKFPEAWRGWHNDPQNNPIPGGETLLDLQARALPEFHKIAKKHRGEAVCIVTHYCVFNTILCSLVSSLANFRCFDTRNGTIAEIVMENVPRLRIYEVPESDKKS